MAASTTVYYHTPKICLNGTVDLDTDTLKWRLVSSSYTPSQSHTQWSDVSANEIASGGGYSTGGFAATGLSVTNAAGVTTFTVNNIAETATGGNIGAWRYAVLVANKTAGGLTDPVLCYVLGDTTPADVPATIDGSVLRVIINANGLFRATVP